MKHAGVPHLHAVHPGQSVHAAPEFCHFPHTVPHTSMTDQGKNPLQMMHLMAAEGEIMLLCHSLALCLHQDIRKGSGKMVTAILSPETLPAPPAFP